MVANSAPFPLLFMPKPNKPRADTAPHNFRPPAAWTGKLLAYFGEKISRPEAKALAELLMAFHLSPCERAGARKPCPIEEIPCNCELRQAGKPCACWPKFKQCKHTAFLRLTINDTVTATVGDMVLKIGRPEAAALLSVVEPEEYGEPPAPASPGVRLTKGQELDLFNIRAAIRRADDAPRRALRHPEDVLPAAVDVLSERAELGKHRSGEMGRAA